VIINVKEFAVVASEILLTVSPFCKAIIPLADYSGRIVLNGEIGSRYVCLEFVKPPGAHLVYARCGRASQLPYPISVKIS
jgi:hypothetical protein